MGRGVLLCLVLSALLAGCLGQKCLLITPNILKLESEETIVVDGNDKAFEAEVAVHDFPKRSLILAKQKISLNNGNNFLGTATVTIASNELTKDSITKKYVYVTVKSPVCNLEKVVLLSHQSGYVVIQTDKTIYQPGSTVLYRIFSMDHKMSPVNTNVVIDFLTPDNLIVNRYVTNTGASGISSLSYRLPELVSLGVWTISAKYEDSSVQIYSTNFGVKEFVPPSYDITLIPEKKYFYVDDAEFSVNIEAKFLHGDPVNGMAYVIFGVKKNGEKTSLPDTFRRILISDGKGVAVLSRTNLVKYLKTDDEMLQHTLSMSISIITPAGSDIVESELADITIVKSPYKVLFTKTSKYFKPGMPYDLKVFVANPDGSPAIKVPVVAEPGMVRGITGEEGTVRLTLNTASHHQSLLITVKTADPALPDVRQAATSMSANSYQSDGNFLYIGVSGTEVTPGDTLIVNFLLQSSNAAVQSQIQYFTYLITNKGRILKVTRQPRIQNQFLVTMSLHITEELIPSFRIIAYYIVGDEIVSDSIWIDVMDSERCIGTLLVTGNTKRDNEVQRPGASMKLKIQADHNAYVGLVAVDKGLNMMNRNFKMSQKKVWDTMEKSDTGCTPGSGANSMGVFYDAGLALQSSFQKTTQERSAMIHYVESMLFGNAEVRCGNLVGSEKSKVECRPPNIVLATRRVFFRWNCQHVTNLGKLATGVVVVEGDEFDEYLPDEDIFIRTEFPESWLWRLEKMTEKPDNNGISTKLLNVYLKDSITTWEVLAVSLSPNKGICVAKTHEIQVKTNFFIDLKLPDSVVKNEQLEIRAVLYNYGLNKIKVRVDLKYNPEFCSLSTARRNYRQIVDIAPQSSVSVPFTLVPLRLGYHDVQVTASGNFMLDGVKRKLKVVEPKGTFKEEGQEFPQAMMGGIKGSSEDVSLTAFVLIVMLESEKICTSYVNNLRVGIERAATFLLGQFSGLTKPHTIAMTSYALALAGSIDQPERLLSASTDKVQWDAGSRFLSIEATSYALLALLRLKKYDLTGPIVRWIKEQRYYGEVSGSTQATFVMFQALAQYQIDIPNHNTLDLHVTLNLPEMRHPIKYLFSPENAMLARSATTRVNKEFTVKAEGKGQAAMTVMSVYYALLREKEKECKNFDLSVTVKDDPNVSSPEGTLSTASVEICARHLKGSDATMSILDVSMMTGFVPDFESLNKLKKGVDKYISTFEIKKASITEGSLIIYLDKISHREDDCIKFNVHQMFNVGLIQPASVTVYDYYSPENRCTKTYHVNKESRLLGMLCRSDECRCAEGNCFLQQQLEGEISAQIRLEKVCAPGVDYVYKARIEEIQSNDNYDNYMMKIISVIMGGADESVLDKQRNFISHVKCRQALHLKKGHDYLIWGVSEDMWLQPSGYSYIIGKDTWIEHWPNENECKQSGIMNLCNDLTELSEELELFGCKL
ncbi:venom factor-like [Anomaloglossus baeobatrachus]